VAHIARTRGFAAGTLLGSGTVSNADPARGVSCLVERRAQETVQFGAPTSAYLKKNDRLRIEMRDPSGRSIFGALEQVVI
jgi:fumarylacetoacetate (FAA) hydrolase